LRDGREVFAAGLLSPHQKLPVAVLHSCQCARIADCRVLMSTRAGENDEKSRSSTTAFQRTCGQGRSITLTPLNAVSVSDISGLSALCHQPNAAHRMVPPRAGLPPSVDEPLPAFVEPLYPLNPLHFPPSHQPPAPPPFRPISLRCPLLGLHVGAPGTPSRPEYHTVTMSVPLLALPPCCCCPGPPARPWGCSRPADCSRPF
jgi:hypothetical protein